MSLGSVVILYSLYLMSVSGQKLDQEISWTRKKGEVVSFSCKDNDRCRTYVYWYQKKEVETFTLILIIEKDGCGVYGNFDHPQEDDFSAMRKKNTCDLKIQSVKVSHSATYYCACGGLEFGSGTTLYVTDGNTRKPKVTVYPASSSESNGKTTLLCLARDMFPDLVKISWKMEDGITEVPKAEGEQLEKREEGQTTSMIIIDKENTYRNKYICSVEHELGAQHFDIPKEDTPTTMSSPTCPFRNDMQEYVEDSFQSTFSLNLASVVYTVMIVKSMVYCCGLSLLLHNRNLGRGPST